MTDITLQCPACEATHPADLVTPHCRECGSPLDVSYADAPDGESIRLPTDDPQTIVFLGEGTCRPCRCRQLGTCSASLR